MKVHGLGPLIFGHLGLCGKLILLQGSSFEANDPCKLEGSFSFFLYTVFIDKKKKKFRRFFNLFAKGAQKTQPKGIRWNRHPCPQPLAT